MMAESAAATLHVVARLDNEWYGLDVQHVREIIHLEAATRVPRTPPYIVGVINLRGWVVAVVDLRRRLGLRAAEAGAESRIVVVELGGEQVGLVVDAVAEVLEIPSSAVGEAVPVVGGVDARWLKGIARVGERLILLLDLERVLALESAG